MADEVIEMVQPNQSSITQVKTLFAFDCIFRQIYCYEPLVFYFAFKTPKIEIKLVFNSDAIEDKEHYSSWTYLDLGYPMTDMGIDSNEGLSLKSLIMPQHRYGIKQAVTRFTSLLAPYVSDCDDSAVHNPLEVDKRLEYVRCQVEYFINKYDCFYASSYFEISLFEEYKKPVCSFITYAFLFAERHKLAEHCNF